MSKEFGNDFVTLTGEDGETFEFEILKEIEIDGVLYAALLPFDKESEEDEDTEEDIYIVRIIVEGDEEIYEVIEDDDEYEKIAKVFEAEFENEIEGCEELDDEVEDEE